LSPKQWWIAAGCSVAVAGVLIFFSDSNLLHIVAMGFVFLTLWMMKQRRVAARQELTEALRDALKNERQSP
jgi:Flp pilus assembly protein TadB